MLFSSKRESERFGVIVDIGSGSVLAAVIHSENAKAVPTIVWSHREHAPLKSIASVEESAKAVMTALMQVLMLLDSEGRSALKEYKSSAKIKEIQYCISAPWAYTITKNISYTEDNEFEITDELLEELEMAAEQKTNVELSQSDSVSQLGLSIVARTTMDLSVNGYQVKDPLHKKATALALAHASVITQQYLVNEIDELQTKLFPEASSKKLSYMLALYCISQDFTPKISDVCLVDITYEATEIGIVRDNTLRYSTHTPFGSFSLAREIAHVTGAPIHEAFGYLHEETAFSFIETLPSKHKEEVGQIFEAYIERVAALFHETGDALSIPKRLLIHTDAQSESLFCELIEKAAKRAIKSNPIITLLTGKLLTEITASNKEASRHLNDTAMVSSAQFFHKRNHCHSFEYL